MPDRYEAQYRDVLDINVNDAHEDPDGDGLTNLQEYQLGINPGIANQIGPVNFGFDEVPTDSPDYSFRNDHPSDLYPDASVAGWQAPEGSGSHIEIWDEGDGNPYIELQAHWGAHGIEQTFDMLPGSQLNFILRYKGRYDWEGWDDDDNAFDLKVEGALEVLVDGTPAESEGGVWLHSVMETDSWPDYGEGEGMWEEWTSVSVSISTDPEADGLVPVTLTLSPQNTTDGGSNEITHGGFIDLIIVEIVIRKQGEKVPEDGVLVKVGDTIEIALAENFFNEVDNFESMISWQYRQLKGNGSYDDWTGFGAHGTGTKMEQTINNAGIYQIRAVVMDTLEYQYLRKKDEKINQFNYGLGNIGEADSVGVCDTQLQIDICREAQAFYANSDYEYLDTVPEQYGFPEYGPGHKCNIFVAHRASAAGAVVPAINGYIQRGRGQTEPVAK